MSDAQNPEPELGEAIAEMGGETLYWCMQCGLCTAGCPWRLTDGEINAEFNARKLQHMGQLGLEGYESDNNLYACTTCGLCVTRCPRDVNAINNIRSMRMMLAEGGVVPQSYRPIVGSLTDNGNPWMEGREKRTAWIKDLDVPTFTEDTEYLLYVCCTSCYDARSQKIARAVATLLNKAGVSWGIIGEEESCCGESIRKIGQEELFTSLAEGNIELFKGKGVKKIITTSPHCLYTFASEYPELGGEFEVQHYTQLLAALIREGKLKLDKDLGLTVAFHDPCYLGRHCEIYQDPRDVLAALPGTRVMEMTRNRESSVCCGGGGGRVWMETPPGERFGDLRVNDALAHEASVLVTTCPYCTIMMEASVLGLDKDEEISVKDVAELLVDALG
jgi:Fe-S oxidoreductase